MTRCYDQFRFWSSELCSVRCSVNSVHWLFSNSLTQMNRRHFPDGTSPSMDHFGPNTFGQRSSPLREALPVVHWLDQCVCEPVDELEDFQWKWTMAISGKSDCVILNWPTIGFCFISACKSLISYLTWLIEPLWFLYSIHCTEYRLSSSRPVSSC